MAGHYVNQFSWFSKFYSAVEAYYIYMVLFMVVNIYH